MLMADPGVGLWGALADTDSNENDNMSIDFDSFMQLLEEEPCHPEIKLEDLSSSDLPMKDLFPGTGTSETIEPAVKKLEACSGNYSSIDDAHKMVGAPESSASKQIGVEVCIPVTSEASVGSSISHSSDGTFADHISSFTNCSSSSIHCNDHYHSFNIGKAIPAGVKDEVGIHLTVESNSGCHISGTSASSSFADNGVAHVTEPDSKYGFDDLFLSLGKIYSSNSKTEAKGPPLQRNSLTMSTFSNKKQMVKYEMYDLAVANSSNEGSTGINSRLAEHDFQVNKEEKEIDTDRHSYVKGCHQYDTSMIQHVPESINEHRVEEKDIRIGRATAYNRYPHFKSICIEENGQGTFDRPNVTATFPSNPSLESAKSNSINCTYQVDDDSDICIIEEMSHPAPSSRPILPGKYMIPPKPGTLYDSHHHFGLEGTFKPRSEQIIFPEVSTLQDMSQQRAEVDPPKGTLAVPLLRHQRIALAWMVQKESALNCSGGILADDQGLGKTVSTISLILKERSPSFKDRQENEKVHTSDLDEDDDNHDRKFIKSKVIEVDADPVDASSGTASSENNCSLAQRMGRPSGGTLVVCPTSVLRQWSDELHNKVSEQAKLSVIVYHGGGRTRDPFQLAKYDVVVTTYAIVSMEVPKQPLVDKSDSGKHSASNNKRKWMEGKVAEATAGPLAKVGWFRVVLDEAQSIKNHKTQVARACWGLRAKRRWCLSGTPIQNAIDDLYSYFRFLRYDPYDKYTTFCSRVKYPIQSSSLAGYQKLQAILKTVMLRRTKDTLLDGQPIINLPPKTVILQKVEFSDEERDFYLQLEADSQAQFKEYAAAGKVRENYVNILLMLLRLRQACDHPLLVKGFDASTEWKQSIDMAKRLPPEKQRHLLNCLEASLAICTICHDPPEGAVVSICGHVFCNQCISEQMTGDERDCPAKDCKDKLSRASLFPRAALDTSSSSTVSNTFDANEPPSPTSLYGSSKIRAALNALKLLTEPPQIPLISPDESNPKEKKLEVKPDKAILFSQWTKMLDLIEAGLKSYGIQYRRLDGTLSVAARDKAVKEFNTLPEVTVMIMSLKAASLGLNMVAANHVLMMDLWWNPTTEDQAIDRAHRIGQTRPVTVLRLTVNDTVEDRILELQRKKREMVASAFGEDQSGNRESRLTVEDLNYLFRV